MVGFKSQRTHLTNFFSSEAHASCFFFCFFEAHVSTEWLLRRCHAERKAEPLKGLYTHSTPALISSQERRREEVLNQRLRRQVAQYQAPGVAEYMQAKENHRRLLQSVHTWEKKVEVAQVSQQSSIPSLPGGAAA